MSKVDWANLEIIEEWPEIDPGNPQALFDEGKKLRLLISLLLTAREREQVEQARRTEKENDRIRRKAGLIHEKATALCPRVA